MSTDEATETSAAAEIAHAVETARFAQTAGAAGEADETAGAAVGAAETAGAEAGGAPGAVAEPAPTAKLARAPVIVVAGTNTGAGKTAVAAVVAAAATAKQVRVAVLKLAQTGATAGAGITHDVDTVQQYAKPATTRQIKVYPSPLEPLLGARSLLIRPLTLVECLDAVRDAAASYDLVVVDGTGGLLTPIGIANAGTWNITDLARVAGATLVLAVRAGVGSLNLATLALEALARRQLESLVVVTGWPLEPRRDNLANLEELRALAGRIDGLLPENALDRSPVMFRVGAPRWVSPELYGDGPNLPRRP